MLITFYILTFKARYVSIMQRAQPFEHVWVIENDVLDLQYYLIIKLYINLGLRPYLFVKLDILID